MITFFDYDGEWLIAPLVAKESGEANPILVCLTKNEDRDNCHRVCPDEYEVTSILWHQIYTDKLNLIRTFERNCKEPNTHFTYQIYEITDLNAYHSIWLRSGTNHSIAQYVFSSDCNLNQLEILLSKSPFLDSQSFKSLATWSYWQQFGGGVDEHFAYYFSKKPEQITKFKYYLEKDHYKDRYQNNGCIGIEEHGIASLMAQLPDDENCLLCLYKEPINSVLDIATEEAHRAWWMTINDAKEDEYDDENYEIFLAYKEELGALLKELDSNKSLADFTVGNYRYRITHFDNWNHLKDIWNNYEMFDFIEGIFSTDTNIESLKQKIMHDSGYTQPENLIQFGTWCITRIRDNGYFHDTAMLYTERKDYFEKYLGERIKDYECHSVNDEARQYG